MLSCLESSTNEAKVVGSISGQASWYFTQEKKVLIAMDCTLTSTSHFKKVYHLLQADCGERKGMNLGKPTI